MLGNVIELLGGRFVGKKDLVDYDLSLDRLEKDSLIKVFTENDVKRNDNEK